MIHHWNRPWCSFSPRNSRDVLGVLEDYDRHSVYYAPDVRNARESKREEGDHFRVFLRFRRHKVITVVLDTEA